MPCLKKTCLTRNFCILLFILSSFFIIWRLANSEEKIPPPIILFSIDTLRPDHLSCYGYPLNTSANIDRFAKEGILFKYALTQAPSTAPSHMTVFTALTPGVHRISDLYNSINSKTVTLCRRIPTMAQLLKKHNYLTAGFYETGAMGEEFGFGRGFDIYKPEIKWDRVIKYPNALLPLRRWISKANREKKPLFIFLHHYICHDPYLRAPSTVRDNFLTANAEGGIPPDIDLFKAKNKSYREQRRGFWGGVDKNNPLHIKNVLALYDSSVYFSDLVFGEVMRVLKEEGIYDKAIIILFSDHGEEFFEHGNYGHGRLLPENLSVALIIKFPKQEYAGLRIYDRVRLMDIMPTLFDFLHFKRQRLIQGVSFLPLLKNKIGVYHPLIVSYATHKGFIHDRLRILQEDFAYYSKEDQEAPEGLYDVKADPRELQDISRGRAESLKSFSQKARMMKIRDERLMKALGCEDLQYSELNEATLDALKSLGYLQ